MAGTNASATAEQELLTVSSEVLQRLQEQTGDEDGELLRELIEVFVMDAEETCVKLAELLAAQDANAIGREAHRLKSGAANLGAIRMTFLCKSLEQAGNAGDIASIPDLLENLTREVPQVQAGLQAYVADLPPAP